jgi:hypothetical protein
MDIKNFIIKRINQSKFKKIKYFHNKDRLTLFDKKNEVYYNGVFGFNKNTIYLTDLVIDLNLEINDVKYNLDLLDSVKGRRYQRDYFRDNIYNKIKKWFKNRKIEDSELFESIIMLIINGFNIEPILKELDLIYKNENIEYSMKSLLMAKYRVSTTLQS